ncbi:putative pyruvate kinase [Helianthus annuus]|nr:putative pyruvate kinase [Helianthus annuus]
MSHMESIASSAVRAAIKVKASVIICFTSAGRAARLIAKYRPTMHVLSVVIPRLKTNQLHWTTTGAYEARQSLITRGLFPMLADPRNAAESTGATNETILKVAFDHGRNISVIKPHDRVVVCRKSGMTLWSRLLSLKKKFRNSKRASCFEEESTCFKEGRESGKDHVLNHLSVPAACFTHPEMKSVWWD